VLLWAPGVSVIDKASNATFLGLIDGAALEVTIKPTGTKRFALEAEALPT
jgi:hypothetical protein